MVAVVESRSSLCCVHALSMWAVKVRQTRRRRKIGMRNSDGSKIEVRVMMSRSFALAVMMVAAMRMTGVEWKERGGIGVTWSVIERPL